jgi:glycosyltransferase involved in cell wall biosynthesis
VGESAPLTSYASLLYYWTKRLAVRELRNLIARERPDLIHVKGRIIVEALPVLPSERTVYQHALMGTRDPSWADNEVEAFSVFLNRIAKVLVQGKRIAGTFAESFDIKRPIDVVFTMAPDEAGGQVSGVRCQVSGLRFGILCRFTEQKGIPFILDALRMFKERHGAVDFTFAGQGPLEETIREFVSREAAKDAKGGVSVVPVTTAVDVLKGLDVFVHPGLDDAMPVSIVEALMCGVPCIVSDVGASPELVRDGVEGKVIPPASAEAILEAMEGFAEMTAEELAGFKRRARERYEVACRSEVVGRQVAEVYRGVLASAEHM